MRGVCLDVIAVQRLSFSTTAVNDREHADNTGWAYSISMAEMTAEIWIAACAHRLQQRWRTVDPLLLEEVAADLWRDDRLRALPPDAAAVAWLDPVQPTPF